MNYHEIHIEIDYVVFIQSIWEIKLCRKSQNLRSQLQHTFFRLRHSQGKSHRRGNRVGFADIFPVVYVKQDFFFECPVLQRDDMNPKSCWSWRTYCKVCKTSISLLSSECRANQNKSSVQPVKGLNVSDEWTRQYDFQFLAWRRSLGQILSKSS